MTFALYAVTAIAVGLYLLRIVDRQRLRAALASSGDLSVAGDQAEASPSPDEERPTRTEAAGTFEGDVILPPYGA